MNPIERAKETLELAEASTDARIENAKEEKGLPTWLATLIDVATVIVAIYIAVEFGGLWLIPCILFGGIAALELFNRMIERFDS